jgi:signal transduction histidine kinase/ActR/RegA family two-component response regulator
MKSYWHHFVDTLLSPVLLLVNCLFIVLMILVFKHFFGFSEHLIQTKAIENAKKITLMLNEFRTIYTSEVVNPIAQQGGLVTHDYQNHAGAIPLPATMTKLLGARIGIEDSAFNLKLRSEYPFPFRNSKALDFFEFNAINAFKKDPNTHFYRFEEKNSKKVLRYAIADVMRDKCVQCHNSHPETPKNDWQVGDVRGILSVTYPLTDLLNSTKQELHWILGLILTGCLIWVSGFIYLIIKLSVNAERLHIANLGLEESNLFQQKQTKILQLRQQELNKIIQDIDVKNNQLEQSRQQMSVINTELEKQASYLEKANTASMNVMQDMAIAKATAEKATLSKSEFLANMSHEIRTPMNGIMGLTQILMITPLDDEQKSYLETLDVSAKSMMRLLNDILDFSKIEANQLELESTEFNLIETVQQVIDLMSHKTNEKNVDLLLEYDLDETLILCSDSIRLKQILSNLINNAIKFTDKGHIKTRIETKNIYKNKIQLLFEVEDTGIGIPEAKQLLIFDKFSQADTSITRQYGGTGLGLAICRQLTYLFDGEIGIKSNPSGGSIFWFTIEVDMIVKSIDENQKNMPVILQEEQNNNACFMGIEKLEILVVEDNPVNQLIVKSFLKRIESIEITMAKNGIEAVNYAKKQKFDLILMDCQMPEMDGFEATEHIRQQSLNQATTIIAVTANAMSSDRELCLTSGMDDYLSKPLEYEKLVEKLQLWVGKV